MNGCRLSGLMSRPVMSNTHDYSRPVWGHACTFEPVDGGQTGKMIGFGLGIETGHYLIIRNGTGTTRYQVSSISYFRDPADMWSAQVVFAARPAPPEQPEHCAQCGAEMLGYHSCTYQAPGIPGES